MKCSGKVVLNAEALKTAATGHSAFVKKSKRDQEAVHKQEHYEFVELALLYLKYYLIYLHNLSHDHDLLNLIILNSLNFLLFERENYSFNGADSFCSHLILH